MSATLITEARGKTKKDRDPKCPLNKIKKAFRELPKNYQKPFLDYATGGKSKGVFGAWNSDRSYDSDAYGTPKNIIDLVRQVLREIELDPASNEVHQQIVQATKYFTKKDDCLKPNWLASTVFVNPPYSNVRVWIEKAISEYRSGRVNEIIFLTHSDTSTEWYRMAMRACSAVCFYGRIKFTHTDETIGARSTNGTLFFYFGDMVLHSLL